MKDGENKSFSILSDKLGEAFAKAEQDQKVLEEIAERFGYEMPVSKVLNDEIERIKSINKSIDKKAKHERLPYKLFDAHGDEIKK